MRRETPVLKQTKEISVLSMNITWREGGREGEEEGRGKRKGEKRGQINDNKNSEICNDIIRVIV